MMQTDKYSLSEKILRDVESVVIRDENLEEFVIIPVSLNQNKSPVIHVEHNLGLESWCVKHVYTYAYQKTLEIRRLVAKRKLLHEEYSNVNRLILGVLLINPDVYTFWNMRRELVLDGLLDICLELKIAKLILSHRSKSNEAFAYRKWLLRKILSSEIVEKTRLYYLLNEELKVCDMTAKKSPNNYHAWSHRIWCMENIARVISDTSILVSELRYTEQWISEHVSEHTGFHYRQYILNRVREINTTLDDKYVASLKQYFKETVPHKPSNVLLHLLGNTPKFWNESSMNDLYRTLVVLLYDLKLNAELNETFQEHESIWCYRRCIVHRLFSFICEYFGVYIEHATNLDLIFTTEKRECNVVDNITLINSVSRKLIESGERCPKLLKHERTVIHSSKLFRFLLENEKLLIDKCAKMNNRQSYLSQRYEKWLFYILGLSNV